ncbi:MAG: FAD-binding oxidoreductase [Chloroflexi bacterium]|nr:FAD-binding oxidoreductase [Chloroflexota bacterium]
MQFATQVQPARSDAADLSELEAALDGDLLRPGTAAYDEARAVWNLVHDRKPAAIVRVASARDVQQAVAFARRSDLEIAVRSGGHSLAGFSTGDGVLVIDMRGLRGLHIDPETRTVFAGAGLTAGEVTAAAAEHELAVPFGDTSTVGISGLTLGGGIGFLARKHGLAIDHVRSFEVVTADAELVTASATENADLYWALRGGGGNFGIVTRFEYDAVSLGETLSGALVLPLTTDVVRGLLEAADAAPEELTTITFIMGAPPAPFIPEELVGTPVVMITLVWAGDPAAGQEAVAPFRALATPIADLVMPMPYPGIYQFTDDGGVPAPNMTRSIFARDLDEAAIETIVARMSSPETPAGAITQLRTFGGAMARVPAGATAFAHRDAKTMFSIFTIHVAPEKIADDAAWTEAYFAQIAPAATGVYVNFLEAEGEARVRQAYPAETLRRLVEAKATWDPDNVFRRNQNIRPA